MFALKEERHLRKHFFQLTSFPSEIESILVYSVPYLHNGDTRKLHPSIYLCIIASATIFNCSAYTWIFLSLCAFKRIPFPVLSARIGGKNDFFNYVRRIYAHV